MNANQIADELESIYWVQGDGKGKPFQQYADFVRQQQAEIEALKNAKRFIQNFAEEQHHRACQLEEAQEADNEPVAWMYEKPNGASKLSFVKEKMLWEDMTETPLYTHPVKKLTDAIETLKYLLEVAQEDFKTMNSHFVIEQVKQALKELSDE